MRTYLCPKCQNKMYSVAITIDPPFEQYVCLICGYHSKATREIHEPVTLPKWLRPEEEEEEETKETITTNINPPEIKAENLPSSMSTTTTTKIITTHPVKKWIPCSRHNPYRSGKYLVTIQDIDVPEILDIAECDYYVHGGWHGFPGRIGQLGTFQVIAWRDLDEPYNPNE